VLLQRNCRLKREVTMKRYWMTVWFVALAVSAASAGQITGTVKLDGAAPYRRAIDMSKDANCVAAREGRPATVEDVVADASQGLANVVVYVSRGVSGDEAASSRPVQIDQKGCQYFPHVVAVDAGQHVTIRNSDQTLHNVHALGTKNSGWNKLQPRGAPPLDVTWANEEVAVPIKDNTHPWMHAYVAVVKGPHAVSDGSGSFKLDNLQPGTYALTAWHETYGTQTKNVTVTAGRAATVGFTFKATQAGTNATAIAQADSQTSSTAAKSGATTAPDAATAGRSVNASTTGSGHSSTQEVYQRALDLVGKISLKDGAVVIPRGTAEAMVLLVQRDPNGTYGTWARKALSSMVSAKYVFPDWDGHTGLSVSAQTTAGARHAPAVRQTAVANDGIVVHPMFVAFSFSFLVYPPDFGGDGAWGAAVDQNEQTAMNNSGNNCASMSQKPDWCGTANGGHYPVCLPDGKTKWVAMAISNDGQSEDWADGEAIGYDSEESAEQGAVANCNHAGCAMVWSQSVDCGNGGQRAQVSMPPGMVRGQTMRSSSYTYRQDPGGVAIREDYEAGGIYNEDIRFSDIANVALPDSGNSGNAAYAVMVTLKNSHNVETLFSNLSDAQDAYNFFKAQIR
jgi:plastocyanin